MKYAEPEAVKLCENDFYEKHGIFFSKEEENKLKEIKTLSECRIFITEFLQKRDTDPTTQENEWKEMTDKRISDIENEALFQKSGTTGFSFKNSGDFKGEAAKVYMLHGPPDYAETLEHGKTYVDLMLWVYADENGNHKYRFLFYQKNGFGTYVLFRPSFDIWYGLQEINKNPTITHPDEVYYELERDGKYIFLYSMVYFSDNLSMNVDKALQPPRPASLIAKELAPKIQGESPQKENIVISSKFSSTIPAEFSYELENGNLILKIVVRHKNLDWIFKNGELVAELSIKAVIWFNDEDHRHEERQLNIVSSKEKIENRNSTFVFELPLPLEKFKEYGKISIYIKNNDKYNSWIEEIKR